MPYNITKRIWLQKPVTAICIIFALCILSIFIITGSKGKEISDGNDPSYSIIIRHYGVDAREMERTVAIPLEDALSSIAGVKNVLTSSENSRVKAFVRFEPKFSGHYEAVREAAQRVYESLPRSAQRPEIVSSDNSRIPVWTAAVFNTKEDSVLSLGSILERIIKPALEGLPGAGEVEVSGTGLPEIVVALKPEVAAARGLNASKIAMSLGMNDAILPGGILEKDNKEIIVTIDGRYNDRFSLMNALVPLDSGGLAKLSEVAEVYEQDREPDIFSRLNGKKTAVIAIMASSDTDIGKLSKSIKSELENFKEFNLHFEILSDRGAEEAASYRSVLSAAIQGAIAVALMAAILTSRKHIYNNNFRSHRITLISTLSVPLIFIMSAALLSVLGFSLNKAILAGLAAGVGAAVDATILSSERLGRCQSIAEGKKALYRLTPSLISGSVTTIVALLPLTGMGRMAGGINAIAWAVGTVTLLSLIAALILLPPLFLSGIEEKNIIVEYKEPKNNKIQKKIKIIIKKINRQFYRILATNIKICVTKPLIPIMFWIIISLSGITVLILAGADVSADPSNDSVYAQVEFEGGLRKEEVDSFLATYSEEIKLYEGIKNVQTSARVASGSVLISFEPQKNNVDNMRDLARSTAIPGGFVYIPETSANERIWEITISGDDDEKCRELAQEVAHSCGMLPIVRETVLNFKDGSKRLTFTPDRERLIETGLSFYSIADTVRRGVYGPVAYKRIGSEGETDVRVRGTIDNTPTRIEVEGLLINSAGNIPLRLNYLMNEKEGREPSSIRREDRRRVASISIRTKPMDPRIVRDQVNEVLKNMNMPRGYAVEFDREAIKSAEKLSGTVFFFLLAILFCYMVIAAANESFGIPLAVLSVLPPSLAIPAICIVLSGSPINAAVACAFVAVSGMAVNAAVLTVEELRHFFEIHGKLGKYMVYKALRTRLPVLLATTTTTIAGAIPFLFLREGANTLVRTLSLVTAMGVGTSCLCSLTMIPALLIISKSLFRRFKFSLKENINNIAIAE